MYTYMYVFVTVRTANMYVSQTHSTAIHAAVIECANANAHTQLASISSLPARLFCVHSCMY